jgi:hypothetical protein
MATEDLAYDEELGEPDPLPRIEFAPASRIAPYLDRWPRFARLIAPAEEPELYADAYLSDESTLGDFFTPTLTVEPVRLRRMLDREMTAEQRAQHQRYQRAWHEAYLLWLADLSDRLEATYGFRVHLQEPGFIVDLLAQLPPEGGP